MTHLALETLITRYEDAIFDPLFDPDTCALLAQQVAAVETEQLRSLRACHERAALAHGE